MEERGVHTVGGGLGRAGEKGRGVEVPGRGPFNRPAADTTPTGVSVETAVWSARRAGVAASRLGKVSLAGAPEMRIRHTWGTTQ